MIGKLRMWLIKNDRVYHLGNLALSTLWILLMLLGIAKVINLDSFPINILDSGLWVLFTADYIARFIVSDDKWAFFKSNIFDLIAILPLAYVSTIFSLHLKDISRINRLARIVGLFGRLFRNKNGILYTNGFIYVIYICAGIIVIGSGLFSVVEGRSYLNSLWWAIVTVTTVGYGDIAPVTVVGKILASIMMFIGIGFIGILTSTITSYFSKRNDVDLEQDEHVKLEDLQQQLSNLKADNILTQKQLNAVKKQNIELNKKLDILIKNSKRKQG